MFKPFSGSSQIAHVKIGPTLSKTRVVFLSDAKLWQSCCRENIEKPAIERWKMRSGTICQYVWWMEMHLSWLTFLWSVLFVHLWQIISSGIASTCLSWKRKGWSLTGSWVTRTSSGRKPTGGCSAKGKSKGKKKLKVEKSQELLYTWIP